MKAMEKIKQSKYIKAGLGIVITLVIALCLVLYMGNLSKPEQAEEQQEVKVEDIERLNDYSDTLSELDDAALKNELTQLIYAGANECVEIDGRYFVVISTGGESASDLEVKEEISLDGNYYLYYNFASEPDGEFKIRYKVFEYNAPVIVKRQIMTVGIEKSGFTTALVYQVNDKKYAYNPISNETEEINPNYVQGIYLFQYLDNEIVGYDKSNSIEIADCFIYKKLSSKLFEVELPNNAVITVSFDELNIKQGTYQTLVLKYDSGFSASIKEGN